MNRMKAASQLLLFALVLSLVPAAALPSQVSAAVCYQAQFVADVTITDGTKFEPNTPFNKTWRLRNIGSCAWNGVTIVFESGAPMGAPASVPVTNGILPGSTVDVSVPMTAPNTAGHYIGYWKFKSEQGSIFGIGPLADKAWWVEINVEGVGANIAYDFTAKAPEAAWSSGAGGLTWPMTDGDTRGYALTGLHWIYEDNTSPNTAILASPQNIANGFIQGSYSDFTVQKGDTFQTQLGCELQARSCYVQFRLAYQKGTTGPITTIFQFNERWEGLTKPPSVRPVNLDFLQGQTVRFILYMSAYGSPIGDRAIWGNPVIVRKGSPPPPTVTGTPPTSTPTFTPGPITVTVPPSSCDRVQFVADVNYPDGSNVAPGTVFTKTWRLKNVGTCAWTTAYQLVFFSGEQMSAPASSVFPQNVDVGKTIDISVPMTAPSAAGSYRGFWMFKNASGALFGIGSQANKPWWVDIRVSGPTVTPGGPSKTPTPTAATITPSPGVAYDFATNACAATWVSGAGTLPCPGSETDARGFVLKVPTSKLESGVTDPRPGIVTNPQIIQDGYIQGFFPLFKVQNGDRFRSVINCEGGATNCYAAFRLDYQTGSDPITTLWGPFLERYEGQFYTMDVDLSFLAGKDVKFILTVLAAGTAVGDRALWVGPHIYRGPGGSALPDLTIGSIRISYPTASCYNPGESEALRVDITNSGTAPAGSFSVRSGSEEQTVNGLAVGETRTLAFSSYNNPVTVIVDSSGSVTESNEANNTRSENIPVPTQPLPCSSPTPTSTPGGSNITPSLTPAPGASPFENSKYGFKFTLPSGATIASQSDDAGRVNLSIASGTNLSEKYLQINVIENAATCASPAVSSPPSSTSNETFNSIAFVKRTGAEGAAGNLYDWVTYSTTRNNACINFAFILHSLNPGNFPVPPPVFDMNAESAVFTEVMNSYNWK